MTRVAFAARWNAAAWFALVACLAPGEPRKVEPMAETQQKLRSYQSHPDSPEVSGLGIALALKGSPFLPGQPIPLRGAWAVDLAFFHRCGGQPLAHTLVIVVRRDEPQAEIRPVIEGHNLPPPSSEPPPPGAEKVLRGGYFNVDLATFTGAVSGPGAYWVMACLGDYVSQRIEFEVARNLSE